MMSRTTAVLWLLLAGCAGNRSTPPTTPGEPTGPAAPAPDPVIGEAACSAIAECDGDRRVTCDGINSCTAVDGLGCRAERASGQPPQVDCCDGTQDCGSGVAAGRVK